MAAQSQGGKDGFWGGGFSRSQEEIFHVFTQKSTCGGVI